MTVQSRAALGACLLLGLAVASVSLTARAARQGEPVPRADFGALDGKVAALMKEWGAPGLAVAIVVDGQTKVLKGFGVRELGKPEPVDGNTVFQLASVTKAFTANISMPTGVQYALRMEILDGLLGVTGSDWSATIRAALQRAGGSFAKAAGQSAASGGERVSSTVPLLSYEGAYAHGVYGRSCSESTVSTRGEM